MELFQISICNDGSDSLLLINCHDMPITPFAKESGYADKRILPASVSEKVSCMLAYLSCEEFCVRLELPVHMVVVMLRLQYEAQIPDLQKDSSDIMWPATCTLDQSFLPQITFIDESMSRTKSCFT